MATGIIDAKLRRCRPFSAPESPNITDHPFIEGLPAECHPALRRAKGARHGAMSVPIALPS
jgi:hypothetical protein